tara:strand:+ start:566 stop:1144 length:579 start_codon:yes stop_codon:yes gene_type:complete
MSSSALSSAKKRRALNSTNDKNDKVVSSNSASNQSTTNTNTNVRGYGGGLTIHQVIQALSVRISKLEENSSNTKSDPSLNTLDHEEINTRFDILVNEIAEIKDILIKLQSFTMEVNKSLYEDRIQILSEEKKEDIVIENIDSNERNESNESNEIDPTSVQELPEPNSTVIEDSELNTDNLENSLSEEVSEMG